MALQHRPVSDSVVSEVYVTKKEESSLLTVEQ